jgi:phage baseplate assembly protein gpV
MPLKAADWPKFQRREMPTFMVALVAEIDVAHCKARVTLPEYSNVKTWWFRVGVSKSMNDKHYWMPEIGEQVLVWCGQYLEEGVIGPAWFNQKDQPCLGADPSHAKKTHYHWDDQTWVEYDKGTSEFRFVLSQGAKFTVNVGESILYMDSSRIRLQAPTVEILAEGNVVIDGAAFEVCPLPLENCPPQLSPEPFPSHDLPGYTPGVPGQPMFYPPIDGIPAQPPDRDPIFPTQPPVQIPGQTNPVPTNPVPGSSYDCTASWYGPGFYGRKTANGEIYTGNDLTAASKELPLGSYAKITNLDNGQSQVVRINDRGPYVSGRCIDLSKASAMQLGVFNTGTARITVTPLASPPIATT